MTAAVNYNNAMNILCMRGESVIQCFMLAQYKYVPQMLKVNQYIVNV